MDIESIDDRSRDVAFRINMPDTYHLVLNHPVSKFSRIEKNFSDKLGIGFQRGFQQCFSPELDLFTVIRLHGESIELVSKGSEEETQLIQFRKQKGMTHSTFSSINSILRESATIGRTELSISEILTTFADYFHWSFPIYGYSCSPHIIPTGKTRTVYRIYKTLLSFQEFTNKILTIHGTEYVKRAAKFRALVMKNGRVFTRDFTTIITQGFEDKVREQLSNIERKFVINGIITEFIRPGLGVFHALTHIIDFVKTYYDLIACIFGIVVSEAYYQTKSPFLFSRFSNLRAEVERIIHEFGKHVLLPRTVSDGLDEAERWPYALSLVKHLFTVDESDNVLIHHPMLICFLESEGCLDLLLDNKQALYSYVDMLSRMSDCRTPISKMNWYEYLRGFDVDCSKLVHKSYQFLEYLKFVKILKQFYY